MALNRNYFSIGFASFVFISLLSKCSGNWWTPFLNCNSITGATPALSCNAETLTLEQRSSCQLKKDICAAIYECQNQFKNYRWNCLIGKNLKRPTREAAYVQAVAAAGLLHTSNRDYLLPFNCYLDLWNDDVVNYAYSLAAELFNETRTPENRNERAVKKMRVHNFKVGMDVAKNLAARKCSCTGPSDSCTIDSCWMVVDVQAVAQALKSKYDMAFKAKMKRNKLVSYREEGGKITEGNLVYLESSPDYCEASISLGLPGTAARQCQPNSPEPDNCQLMCCGREYRYNSETENFICT